jgi:putative membrane protein
MLSAPLAFSVDAAAAVQLAPTGLVCLLYARRAHALAALERPVPGWRQASFYGGFVAVAMTLTLLARVSRELVWARMVEQLLLGDIAPLLVVLGLTAPLLAPLVHVRALARVRVLAHPALAFPLWAVDLYAWHVSLLYQAALQHSGIEALEHAMLLGFGVNMWMCLFGPFPMPSWFGDAGKLIYVLAVRLAGAALANVFLWSNTILYPSYIEGQARFHISPLADQNIAGAIMLVEEAILTLGLFCWLFLRAAPSSVAHEPG